MKHVGDFFGEAAITLVLLAIGLGVFFLVKWGWSESPLITVVSGVLALGFLVFGVVAMSEHRDFGTLGTIAAVTALVAGSAAFVFVQYGGQLLAL